MIIETLISRGMGWEEAGKWFWDVYAADVQGQPSLYSGCTGDYKKVGAECSRAYRRACRENGA